MHPIDINKLLLRFFQQKNVEKEDILKLKRWVNSSKESDVKDSLNQLWLDHTDVSKESMKEAELIKSRILKDIRPKELSVRRLSFSFSRIAAVLVIALLSGIAGYLYFGNDSGEVKELIVMVEKGQKSSIILPDNSKVTLNSNSKLTYDDSFGKKVRSVNLEGEAYMQIAKNKDVPFIINTSELKVEVLGTTLNVYSYANEDVFETSLIEGRVKVSSKLDPADAIILEPNQKAVYNRKTNKMAIQSTDNYYETTWVSGVLSLRSEKFEDVVKKLERFYGIKINLSGNIMKDDRFTGTFRKDQNISEVLKILSIQYSIKVKSQNNEFYLIGK